jgi:hypothetical protein
MAKGDGPLIAAGIMYLLVALFSLAWVGVLIWAVIYVVTHIGEWIA